MRKHLKKFFVPHKHNEYNPHLFRNTSVLTIFAVCTFLLGVSYGNYVFLHGTVLGANIATNVLVDLANVNRTENKVAPLTRNSKLDEAASMKADDMISKNYFAHFAPDGTTPWYFIKEAGYNFIYAGENLAIDFSNAQDVDQAWMNSPLHKENLLNTNFKDLGISAKEGMHNGEKSIYVVQMFGSQNEVQKVQGKVAEQKSSQPPLNKGGVSAQKQDVKVIVESKNFISVKNTEVVPKENLAVADIEVGKVAGVETYSSWYDRFIFDSPYYIQLFFIVVIIIIAFGMALRIIIEYKRQHYRHLVISAIFLFALFALAALNLNFINFF